MQLTVKILLENDDVNNAVIVGVDLHLQKIARTKNLGCKIHIWFSDLCCKIKDIFVAIFMTYMNSHCV